MKKVSVTVSVLALVCALLMGTALADYGYTETSQIPMAVDFNVSVVFDAQGRPQIITDYPFEETGARELNLVYNKGDVYEAITLQYEYPSGKTSVRGWNGDLYSYADIEKKAVEDIRNGEVTLDDAVFVNTARFSAEADWVLQYSLSQHRYLSYEEKTHAQAFNAMGSGGISRSLYYRAGELTSTRVQIRTEDADLLIDRNRTGEIEYASVHQYRPTLAYYDYDASTGLFGGRTLSSLGFADSDLELDPLAMIGDRTGQVSTSVVVADNVPAPGSRGHTTTTIVGGLLAGILIGLTLFRMFRRRKAEPAKPVPAVETPVPEEAPAPEETFETPARHMTH